MLYKVQESLHLILKTLYETSNVHNSIKVPEKNKTLTRSINSFRSCNFSKIIVKYMYKLLKLAQWIYMYAPYNWNFDIGFQYRDTILGFVCIDTLNCAVWLNFFFQFVYLKLIIIRYIIICITLIKKQKPNRTFIHILWAFQLLFQISWYCIVSWYFWQQYIVISRVGQYNLITSWIIESW